MVLPTLPGLPGVGCGRPGWSTPGCARRPSSKPARPAAAAAGPVCIHAAAAPIRLCQEGLARVGLG